MEWLPAVSILVALASLLANVAMYRAQGGKEERKELAGRLDKQRDELNLLDFRLRDGLHERLSKAEFRDYKKETETEIRELRQRR